MKPALALSQPNIDRLLAALRRQKLDRVPNFEIWIGARSLGRILNRPDYAQSFWDMPPAEAAAAASAIGQDAIVCSLAPRLPANGSILSSADLAPYKHTPPDLPALKAKLAEYLAAVRGSQLGVVARLGGPLTQTYMACGPIPIQSFMLLLYDQPELIEECLDLFTDWTLRIIAACRELPFHLFYIGDDLSANCGPLISPEHLAQFWAPRYQKIIAAAHDAGRPVICHCCGDQSPVFPYWLEWGVEACHPLQPQANDIYAVKKRYGQRITLVGNIDLNLLSSGTPAEVREDTRQHLAELAEDGGYVACSGHSIIDSVKPENFLAMIAATHEFGVY